jgi:magnesium transporter
LVPKEYTQNTQTRVDRVRDLIKAPNARIRRLFSLLHPTEIALVLEDCDEETQQRIIRQLPAELISDALAEMDEDTKPGELLTRLHPRAAADLVKELDPDDAADLLAQIGDPYKERILYHVPDEEERVINRLLAYDEESAGGLMNPEVVFVRENMTSAQAIQEVARLSEEIEDFYIIYVVDNENRLTGYLTFKSLFRSKRGGLVREVMEGDIISVMDDTDQEEVAKLMSQYNLPTLPVINHADQLIGRITFDDIMDVMEEENTEDLLNFAGVSEGANLRGGWAETVRSRIPWLLINLMTASIAAFTISQFEATIDAITTITFFMPIIAGVAGNGATQTLAVTVRRISTDGIPRSKAASVVFKEVVTGTINGLMIGALASILAIATNSDPLIGLVVFSAMLANLTIAGLAGSFVPITLERLGVDPAVASSILITAFTDIIGYILLFGLATSILL